MGWVWFGWVLFFFWLWAFNLILHSDSGCFAKLLALGDSGATSSRFKSDSVKSRKGRGKTFVASNFVVFSLLKKTEQFIERMKAEVKL